MTVTQDKQIILVVDDTPENIDVLKGILQHDYRVKAALSGEKALRIARSEPRPDMILLDVMMPGLDGYSVCHALKADPSTASIPVIFVTAKDSDNDETRGLELGAVDYITKPVRPAIVKARVSTQLALSDQKQHLETLVQQRTAELEHSRQQLIRCLGQAAEYKDNETGLHIIRMAHYSRIIALATGKGEAWAELIFQAAPMHDIGKIGVPDAILQKPGKLNDDEWQVMKRHPDFGAQIIGEQRSTLLRTAREIALYHHEKWDGSGYPQGLKGNDIPLTARVVAIADVFDALTSDRPYKKGWTEEDAVALIQDNAGSHFDPQLVPLFLQQLPQIRDIRERYAENTADPAPAFSDFTDTAAG